jgi:hypothetical protein
MADKNESNHENEALLRDSASGEPFTGAKGLSYSDSPANPYSTEAKQRRARLINDINTGWSEESERGLSLIANRYVPKR